jgi:hypothetical protein
VYSVILRLLIKSDSGIALRDVPMLVDFDAVTGRVLSAKRNENHDELGRFASADSSRGGKASSNAAQAIKETGFRQDS